MNTCVGIGNHGSFYGFLVSMWLYLVLITYICVSNFNFNFDFDSVIVCVQAFDLDLDQKTAKIFFFSTILTVLAFVVVFFLPLTLLLTIQTLNFANNDTTQNRLKKKTVSNIGIEV